jgi:hypothetical protein
MLLAEWISEECEAYEVENAPDALEEALLFEGWSESDLNGFAGDGRGEDAAVELALVASDPEPGYDILGDEPVPLMVVAVVLVD